MWKVIATIAFLDTSTPPLQLPLSPPREKQMDCIDDIASQTWDAGDLFRSAIRLKMRPASIKLECVYKAKAN